MRISLFTWICTMLLLTAAAGAREYVLVGTDTSSGKIGMITVIEDNDYYKGLLETSYDTGYSIRLAGETSYDVPLRADSYTLADYDSSVKRITLLKDGMVTDSRGISFCNNNKVCEPCATVSCTLAEDELTCGDCAGSSGDGFCNIQDDRVCDPDCTNQDGCPDCGCVEDEFLKDKVLCADDLNGEACAPGQACTGYLVYADDTGDMCCTRGKCTDSPARLENDSPGSLRIAVVLIITMIFSAILVHVLRKSR